MITELCATIPVAGAWFDKQVGIFRKCPESGWKWSKRRCLVVQFVDLVGSACRSWRRNLFTCIVGQQHGGDPAIKLDIIGLGTLSLTGLCTNCYGYVLRGPVNGR